MSPKMVVVFPDRMMEIKFGEQMTLGRDIYNTLTLQDPEVSRNHAILFEQDGEVLIKDLDSRNGIFINGTKAKDARLAPNTEIIAGSSVMIYEPDENLDLAKTLTKHGRFLLEKHLRKAHEGDLSGVAAVYSVEEMKAVVTERLNAEAESGGLLPSINALRLLNISHQLDTVSSANEAFEIALTGVLELLDAERGVIVEQKKGDKGLITRAMVDKDAEQILEVPEVLAQRALEQDRFLCCADIQRDPTLQNLPAETSRDIHSLAIAPFRSTRTKGFIYLEADDPATGYDRAALCSLYLIAHRLASALRGRRRTPRKPETDTDK